MKIMDVVVEVILYLMAILFIIKFLLLASGVNAQGLIVVDPNTGQYLGNINSNQYDTNSTSNQYGTYGNPYGNTVNNPYSQYGNPYSPSSINNPYTGGYNPGYNGGYYKGSR